MSVQTTTGLSTEMSTYYEKVFLARAEYEYIFKEGGQMRSMPANEGKVITFTRHTPLTTVTTALTEGVNPTEVSLTAANVTAQIAEYGTTVKISRFLSLTSIDPNNKEKIEVVGQNMGETMDEIVRNALYAGATTQLAGAKSLVTAVAASDVLSAAEVLKAVRTLEVNKARKYQGRASYVAKIGPRTKYDLMRDSTWVNAKTYSDVEDLYRGEVGELYGVRFLSSPNQKTESSTVTVYSNFIHGADAFGCLDLDADKPKLYIIPHTQVDSGNPAGRFSVVSWAGSHVSKVLNANWILNIKTGVTA